MGRNFDLSRAELPHYLGRNPRPADHDAFWARGLAEIEALDPQVALTPASFQAPFADCYDLTFSGVGGARIYAKVLQPKDISAPGPALLQFHGYTMDSGDWVSKLPFVAAGMTVVAMDCRGQGGQSEDVGGVSGTTHHGHIIRGLSDALAGNPDRLLFRHIFLDTAQLARIVMGWPHVDAARVGVMGYSQGGGLTLACAALVPEIKRAAPVYPFLSDYLRVWELDMAKEAYGELREWFKRHDPQHKQAAAVFEQLGYIDVQHLAPRIRAEVCWFIGYEDEICPPSTQYAAYNKISGGKRMVHYPDFRHENLPGAQDAIFQFMLGV